ncbi:MAG: hypothetical protein KDK90_27860 [Leptospiraceae bacterium]|nr:hypothetical protein [Leptospiraceae bacterium]
MTAKYSCVFLFFVALFESCSTIQFSKHDGFWEYLKGKPGLQNAKDLIEVPRKGIMFGERHPFYLWFRTPEIIFNPQGGIYYPDMITEYGDKLYDTRDLSNIKEEKLKKGILSYRNGLFTGMDGGLLDFILQYREWMDPSGNRQKAVIICTFSPIWFSINLIYHGQIFIYPIHDVIKTVMIPVAAVYYTVKAFDDNGEEEPEE